MRCRFAIRIPEAVVDVVFGCDARRMRGTAAFTFQKRMYDLSSDVRTVRGKLKRTERLMTMPY